MTQITGDYVKQFNAKRITDPARSALVIIDMQYATGHPTGALAQKMKAEGNSVTDWRFERIKTLVIPNNQRLIKVMRAAGGKVIYITIGAALADCSDAPVHMRAFFESLGNYEGQPAHQIIDELAPEPGDPIVRKTYYGCLRLNGP